MKKTQMVILASLISIPFILSGCAKKAPESGAASPETGEAVFPVCLRTMSPK